MARPGGMNEHVDKFDYRRQRLLSQNNQESHLNAWLMHDPSANLSRNGKFCFTLLSSLSQVTPHAR